MFVLYDVEMLFISYSNLILIYTIVFWRNATKMERLMSNSC
jgi:hypothetical protein